MTNLKTKWVDRLPNNYSAATSPSEGIIYLSRTELSGVPQNVIKVIVNHEKAHNILQTENELLCDSWAFYKSMSEGVSLMDTIKALTRILDFENQKASSFYQLRYTKQLERAKHYKSNLQNK